MTNLPEFLKSGDLVAIVCPASFVEGGLEDAHKLLASWGLRVIIGDTVSNRFHQYAGDDQMRAQDFQQALDNPEVKAIFAARGGYGTVRIIDLIDFTAFKNKPKWIIGFSDITVLHSHIHACFQIATIHGQMPVTIPDGTKTSLESLRMLLFGEEINYYYQDLPASGSSYNRNGEAQGTLIGGNLALLHSVTGSVSEIDFSQKILFIEDVGEYYYNVDRMLWTLKRAGKLDKLAGLIVGGFTAMKDNPDVPFGQSVEQIILDKVANFHFPVAFGFPAGHIDNNQALILGKRVKLKVSGPEVSLQYLNEVDFKQVASQLANPTGRKGIETAERMNQSNGKMTQKAIELLECQSQNQVLEIGPANAKFAEYVLQQAPGIHYSGADISETMVQEALHLNQSFVESGQVNIDLTDGFTLNYPDQTFDRVFSVNTLYFWQDPNKMIQEIHRILKPDGVCCLAFGSKSFMQTMPFVDEQFTLYSTEDVQELLQRNNMTVLSTKIRQHKTSSAAGIELIREEVFVLTKPQYLYDTGQGHQ